MNNSSRPRTSRRRRAGPAALLALALAGGLAGCFAVAGEASPPLRPAGPAATGPASQPPTALIELDGSLSENPDGGNLQYEWRQVAGPPVTLSDPAAAKPNFRTAEPGVYRFELVVTANGLRSAPTPVEIEIERANLAPVAKVPPEVRGQVGDRIEVDGRESFDPEGKELTYRWRALTGGLSLPAAALNMPVLAFGPETDGVYEVELVVSDGETASPPAVTRLAIAPLPRPPVARAKIVPIEIPTVAQADPVPAPPAARPTARIQGPATAGTGAKVVLDGAGSTGRAGAELKYLWRQKSGPFVTDLASTSGGAVGSFTPPRAGEYEIELVVSDGVGESEPARHRITVRKEGEPPVAVVVAPARAETGTLVKMDATQSYDPAGGKLNYRWRQTGGPQVRNYALDTKLGDAAPAFVPTAAGTYVFEVIATTGKTQSRPVEISIDVATARRNAGTAAGAGEPAESVDSADSAGGLSNGSLRPTPPRAEAPASARAESLPQGSQAASGPARSLIPELQPLPSIVPPPIAAAAVVVPSPVPPAPELTPLPLASPMPMVAPAMPAARPRQPPMPMEERPGTAGRAAAQIHPATLSGGDGMPAMPDLP